MSDIRQMLERTAWSAAGPPSAETIEADLQRGRTAMARRRRRRAIAFPLASTLGVAIVAGATLVAGYVHGTDQLAGPSSTPSTGVHQISGTDRAPGIQLVAYTGDQLDGFVVERVPDGWHLQGSRPQSLTIAPQGDTTHPDNFTGKLAVTLLSASAAQELPDGEPVKVGENDGVVKHLPETDLLTYEDGDGHIVQVQAWRKTLGWSNQQLVRFAEGVTVTAAAEPGIG